jgi:hypothetical protein
MLLAVALLAIAGEPTLAEQGVAAFKSVCLDSRPAGLDGARAALASVGAKRQPDLPPLAGSKPMEVWTAGDLEFLLRPNNGRYGCFAAFKPTAATDTDGAVAALSALPGLVVKTVKPSKRVYYEWTFADGSKDSVRLTPDSQQDSVLINLEVRGK